MADQQVASQPDNAGLLSGILLCFASMSCIQFGAAFSATAIDAYGPSTTTFLRLVMAAVVLALIVRPPMRSYSRAQWKSALSLGVTMAAMTLCFFAAIDRIPLGLAVAIEFLGPLAVATWSLGAVRLKRRVRFEAVLLIVLIGVALFAVPWPTLAVIAILYLISIPFSIMRYAAVKRRRARQTAGEPTLPLSPPLEPVPPQAPSRQRRQPPSAP